MLKTSMSPCLTDEISVLAGRVINIQCLTQIYELYGKYFEIGTTTSKIVQAHQSQLQNTPKRQLHQFQKLKEWMTSTIYMFFMSILTIYSIFAIDIDKGFFNHDASVYFSSVHVLSMLIFASEIVVASVVEKDYFLHFYFWIDIFSTLMMVLELIWIEDLMNSTDNIRVAVSFARVSKASRFSKIGARSTKIMKLVRLIKLMKLFRKKQQEIKPQQQKIGQLSHVSSLDKNQMNPDRHKMQNQLNDDSKWIGPYKIKRRNVDPFEQLDIQIKWQIQSQQRKKNKQVNPSKQQPNKGTKVGQILKYQIQKNIVIMVMSLIMIVPLLSASTWFNKTEDMEPSTSPYFDIMKDQTNSSIITSWCNSFVQVSINSSRPIVLFDYSTYKFSRESTLFDTTGIPLLEDLRQSEQTIINQGTYTTIYSKKQETQITSWINMIRSVLIIVLLLITSVMFVQDLETYALTPLEKMSATVCKIQKDPFSVLQDDEDDNEDEQIDQIKQKEELELQTNILQKFFIKITSLLALGVGETPLNSTAQILDTKQTIIDNPIFKNVEGIFVCLQLANLNGIIDQLADRSSSYINHILQIYHETAIENGGYIFHQDDEYSLICWKVDLGLTTCQEIEVKMEEKRKAELAFMFYLQFCDKIAQDPKIKQFQKDYQFLANQSFSKFHLGFHCGTAFCGTIGSQFKLSLKAMGQDISIVKTLCRAAGKYKLQNLVSHEFMSLIPFLTSVARKIEDLKYVQCNKIGTVETFSICGNISLKNHVKIDSVHHEYAEQKLEAFERKRVKKMLKSREEMVKSMNKSRTDQLMTICKSFLKKHSNMDEYLDLWRQSCHCYQEGRWHNAKTGFLHAKECNFRNNDLLTEKRLQEIGSRQEPPSNWSQHVPFSLFL